MGIGAADPHRNPFLQADLPVLRGLLGGGLPTREWLESGPDAAPAGAALRPLEATLGAGGLPQSGTGQASLLTGTNAVRRYGRHFGPWVPVSLRPLVEEGNLMRRALDAGLGVAFANAYPEGWPGRRGDRRLAGPPLAARAAGLLTRHEDALREGRAVSSEIVNDGWRRHLGVEGLPDPSPKEAGHTLAAIAGEHALTLYAHYATDTAGHRGGMAGCRAALERVDAFLGGLLERLPEGHLTVVASDHGNLEDVSTRGHTRNPALGLVVGPDAQARSQEVRSLDGVAPAILSWLGVG